MTDSNQHIRQEARDKHKEEKAKITLGDFLKGLEDKKESSDGMIVIKNVAIPLKLDENFIPPDLEKALNYYPNFIRYSGTNWTIQRYIVELIKRIDKVKPNGLDGDEAFGRFVQYYGFYRFIRDYLKI